MIKYLQIIEKINEQIDKFNGHLKSEHYISPLNSKELDNPSFFTNLKTTKWEDQHWPHSVKSGVYFIFCHKKNNPEDIALYIGKSSFSSKIGNRLYSHLTNYRNAENYIMKDKNSDVFILELVSSVNFEDKEIVFMSSALEELLISEMRKHVHLMNVKGNA
jgi:hypothetical protein